MFFIKIKLKGYLKNITKNEQEIIDTMAIKNKNIISYKNNSTLNKIKIDNNKVILSRDNEKYSYELIFEPLKEHNIEYFIKELKTSIDIKVKTTDLSIKENKISIKYKIIDSNEEFLYLIEMSD